MNVGIIGFHSMYLTCLGSYLFVVQLQLVDRPLYYTGNIRSTALDVQDLYWYSKSVLALFDADISVIVDRSKILISVHL